MEVQERYRKAEEGLHQAVSHMTWLGHFFGFGGALVLDGIRQRLRVKRLGVGPSEALSSLSSTYYAAAGNAKARAAKSFLLKPFWLAVSALVFLRCRMLSDMSEKLDGGWLLVPVSKLELRANVLRRAGKNFEALKRIEYALNYTDEISTNTRVLLLIGEAECNSTLMDVHKANKSYIEAFKYEYDVPVSTHVRLLRSLAGFRKSLGENNQAEMLFEYALQLAAEEGLPDQSLKIEAMR